MAAVLASSRCSVSQGAEPKTAREKPKKARREDRSFCLFFRAGPQLTERLE